MAYNDLDQITNIIAPAGVSANAEFTADGRLAHDVVTHNDETDYNQNEIVRVARARSNSYDTCGRLARVSDPAGNSVSLAYNGLGQVTNIAAPAGRSASLDYDDAGRLVREADFHGRVATLAHDATARSTVVTRPDNSTVTTVRDLMGRLATITSAGDNSRATSLAYNNDGALQAASCTLANDTFSDSYALNLAGEIISRTSSCSIASASPCIINYSRDAGGLVTGITSPLSGFSSRTLQRDALGRVVSIAAASCAASFSYDPNGRLAQVTNGNATITQFSHDPLGRRTSMHLDRMAGSSSAPGPLLAVLATYDPFAPARLLSQTIQDNLATATFVHTYSFDILDQISAEAIVVNNSQSVYNVYAYNGFGDISTSRNEAVTYTGNSTITRGTGGNAVNYRFDTRGNCTNAASASTPRFFEYDADNNIIAASVGPTNWTFRYNAQNQMLYSKLQVNSSTADERCYVYDGLDCIAEATPSGTLLRQFIRNGNIAGVFAEVIHDDPTVPAQYRNATFYYHYNHRGDIIAVTAADGAPVWLGDYDAFGKPLTFNFSTFSPRFTFSTKRYFAELGTYYYGYRWYLSELCRWMQKDPLSAQLLNNDFAFNCNNPVFFVDPDGMVPIPITSIDQLPFSNRIKKSTFDEANQASRLAAYNTLSQIQSDGGTPNGTAENIEIAGERVKIPDGVTWNCDKPQKDDFLASQLKDVKESMDGNDFESSAHFSGSPSLNETKFGNKGPEYDTDLHNPNEGLRVPVPIGISPLPIIVPGPNFGLILHALDAKNQADGTSLSEPVYDSYENQGKLKPPPPAGGGAPPSTNANPNSTPPPPDPPPPQSNQPPSTAKDPPPEDSNGSCNEHKKP